ncbi:MULTISPECIES: hypothetical protein [unclassified Acinetobacter]|uniref:hypothetical protein n=1 Tax=unclassified Acinetobacter TaxID=196816 RepID=UPI0025C27962|nr:MULTISPECIES: hypothetical protein [unclassified Acinetobacter]
MKTFTKFAVFAAMLVGSGLTQAATTTASIPMGVDVPKSCTFSNVSAGIIIPEDGTKARGSFTLMCNTGSFSVEYAANSHANGSTSLTSTNGKKLNTLMNISRVDWEPGFPFNGSGSVGYGGFYGIPVNGFFEVGLQSPITATTEAGVYTDTLNMNVTY